MFLCSKAQMTAASLLRTPWGQEGSSEIHTWLWPTPLEPLAQDRCCDKCSCTSVLHQICLFCSPSMLPDCVPKSALCVSNARTNTHLVFMIVKRMDKYKKKQWCRVYDQSKETPRSPKSRLSKVSNSWAPFLEKLTAGILILCPRLGGRDIKWYLSWKDNWYSHETESSIPQLTESVSFCFPECSVHFAGQQAIVMASWDANGLDAGWYAVLHSKGLSYPHSSLEWRTVPFPGDSLESLWEAPVARCGLQSWILAWLWRG